MTNRSHDPLPPDAGAAGPPEPAGTKIPDTSSPRAEGEKLLGETQPQPQPLETGPPTCDVAVVGAGAAGLTAAIRAAEAGARVILLNAHPRVGLKILMSGGTRCNVTHREVRAEDFHGGSRPFVARVLRAFPVEETLRWFERLGVELKLEETGKYFPVTDDAQTVLDALLGAVDRAGVSLRHGARVVRLERREGAGFRLGTQIVKNAAAFDYGEVKGRRERAWHLPAAE